MLQAASPEPMLGEGKAIGLLDRFALQRRLPYGKTVAGPVPGQLAGPEFAAVIHHLAGGR
jgi:hypothetical protein